MKRVHLVISGMVQGVNFRYYTKKTASNLNLKGYVKNLPDNKVEIVAEGSDNNLKEFVGWCRKGPSSSHVSEIKINYEPYSGEFKEFEVQY